MRKTYLLFPLLIVCFFVACTKEPEVEADVNTSALRLSAIESGTGALRLVFFYDNLIRIIQINSKSGTETEDTLYHISYSGNDIIMVQPVTIPGGIFTDTTLLTLSAGKQLTRRINKKFQEFYPPENISHRSWSFDTTHFEYEASGLLAKATRSFSDTSWQQDTYAYLYAQRTLAEKLYYNQNGQLIGFAEFAVSQNASTHNNQTARSTEEEERTAFFSYDNGYANKLDFVNAAVLQELQLFFGIPLNSRYTHLPNSINETYVRRTNGTVVQESSYSYSTVLTFNKHGLVATSEDPNLPGSTVTYFYSE